MKIGDQILEDLIFQIEVINPKEQQLLIHILNEIETWEAKGRKYLKFNNGVVFRVLRIQMPAFLYWGFIGLPVLWVLLIA